MQREIPPSENPYLPPGSSEDFSEDEPENFATAPLIARFMGNLVDSLVILVIGFATSFASDPLIRLAVSRAGEVSSGLWAALLNTPFVYLVFVLVNAPLLQRSGQTIGKMIVKTKIVTVDGRKPSMRALIVRRYGFMILISSIFRAILVIPDALLILRSDRRCLHDLIAGTKVVILKPELISRPRKPSRRSGVA